MHHQRIIRVPGDFKTIKHRDHEKELAVPL
jgi:hypothetical protein